MTKVVLKRNRNTHGRSVIAAALVLATLAMILYGFCYYNSFATAAGVVPEPVNDVMQVDAADMGINKAPIKYSLGSIQAGSTIKAAPGDKLNTGIDFYNVDGNLTTYITMAVTEAPEGWEIELNPEMAVDVTEILEAPADQLQTGTKCVALGDRGYAIARTSTVKITVPEDEEAGTMAKITITARAEWQGQTGQATISQTRDFNYSVYVLE